MTTLDRRRFAAAAAALGASLALGVQTAHAARVSRRERRDLYPQGVASGDPRPDRVLLWTRRPPLGGTGVETVTVEVAEDPEFKKVVASGTSTPVAAADWTCRVLAAGLRPARVYWYRFTDEYGFSSRVGRTVTAPEPGDSRPVRFAFVSCQNVQTGACNAYRRMIWEDERRPAAEQIAFVLHLGDFIYEVVWYPEEHPHGLSGRHVRDLVRFASREKHGDVYVPTTLDEYRALYRAYLRDPDLQDARARWPFVCVWDNHEFSWNGWQSQQVFPGVRALPAQTRKVAANQAWFEYQPAHVAQAEGRISLERFRAPKVADAAIEKYDDRGLGLESGNLAAIGSLKIFRALRWGANVDLILTDNRSYRSEPFLTRPEMSAFQDKRFPWAVAEEIVDALDAGRELDGGRPAETIRWNGADVPNFRRGSPPQTLLGIEQKRWLFERLRESRAAWKVWGNSLAMLDCRVDFGNLPLEARTRWPGASYATWAAHDWSGCRAERREILDFMRRERIAGFASLAGDRHAFFAGVVAPSLPPKPFDPVGVEFVTGSVSAPGLAEAALSDLPDDHPLYPVYNYRASPKLPPVTATSLSVMHGVRSSFAMLKARDADRALSQALALRNPEVSPHLSFMDLGGHGYSVARATADALEVEFVCIPNPVNRSSAPNGGPLVYRIAHRVDLWKPGDSPRLVRTVLEGTPPLGSLPHT